MLPFIHKGKAAYRFHMQKSQNLEVITVHRYLVADVIRALMAGQPNNFFTKQAVGSLENISRAFFFSPSPRKKTDHR